MKLKSGIALLFLAGLTAFVSFPVQGLVADDSSKWNNSQSFVGIVVSVDGKAGRLTMKTWDNQQKQFLVGSMAALALRSTDSKLTDLKPGDQIIVTAEGNKAISVSLSTTDLKGNSGSNSAYRSQSNPSSDEAMKNKGVDPYRATSAIQPAPPATQGLRDVPLSSSQPTGLIATSTTAQAPSGASNQASPNPPTPTPSPTAGASERTIETVKGSVVGIDPGANLITVKTPEGQVRVFTVDFNTKYNLSSAAGELTDLKEGQLIAITAQGMKVLSLDTNTAAQ